ncbi:MAG TPA: ABC transporter ATP-binding protein [Firmicutes bacterium]|nr:ABC transporter ATP-binding protein [Candidatus Fermentithermobacillaceae bacterium]
MDQPILRTVNLRKSFFLGQTIYAVNDVNLQVDQGEFVVIMGPSGSGKSTLLALLGGLDRPQSGDVILSGERYSKLSENGLARIRRNKVGFVFQFFNLIPHLTALENVMLPMRFGGKTKRQMEDRAKELLDIVGLSARKDHKPLELSGGEQQRVAIARALANEPDVVLADEPTGNLDRKTSSEIGEIFHNLNSDNGQTFIVVSHDPSLTKYAHRVVNMLDGQIVEITGGGMEGVPLTTPAYR